MKKNKLVVGLLTILTLSILLSLNIDAKKASADAGSFEARIGTANYTTFEEAWSAAENDNTIYLLKDANLPTGLTTSKSITVSSQEGERFTLTRMSVGDVFNLQNNAILTLKNIVFDGKSVIGSHVLFKISGGTQSKPILNIMEGTEIKNFKTTNSAPVVFMQSGILSMYGGVIHNNSATVGISVIYSTSSSLNFFGGKIFDNTTESGYGAIYLGDSNVNINLNGNIIIKDNIMSGAAQHNIGMKGSKALNITSDFTGEVGIYSNYSAKGEVFGEISNDSIYPGKILNDKNISLFGEKNGNNLQWGLESYAAYVNVGGVETGYTSFADAWQAAKSAETTGNSRAEIFLKKDIMALDGSFGEEGYLYVDSSDYISLNLNGYKFSRGLTEAVDDGYVFKVDGDLIIEDSSALGNGLIKGGNNTGNGGGIYVGANGQLTVNGGKISGNKALNGGGVYVDGEINISGSTNITDNKSSSADNNVYLTTGTRIAINDNSTETSDDSFSGNIGITMETSGIATSGWELNNGGNILSDNSSLGVVTRQSEISLAVKYHVTYNGNGNTAGTAPVDSSEYYEGDTLVTVGDVGTLVKTGYSLTGWTDGVKSYGFANK